MLSDSSDEEVGQLVSDFERMHRGVTALTGQGECGQGYGICSQYHPIDPAASDAMPVIKY